MSQSVTTVLLNVQSTVRLVEACLYANLVGGCPLPEHLVDSMHRTLGLALEQLNNALGVMPETLRVAEVNYVQQ